MTGGIYDHLLIIGTFCSFIQGMTKAWLLHNLLILTIYEILQESSRKKFRIRRNPRKGIISVQTGFYASRDTGFCVPEITAIRNWLHHHLNKQPCQSLSVQVHTWLVDFGGCVNLSEQIYQYQNRLKQTSSIQQTLRLFTCALYFDIFCILSCICNMIVDMRMQLQL